MHSDIEIKKLSSNVNILGMATKPVRGITKEGTTVYEDNLQIDLQNVGKKSLSFIDCTISYRAQDNKFLGSDSDGSFDELKPGESCVISIPVFIPQGTVKTELKITSDEAQSNLMRYGSLVFLGAITLFWVIKEFLPNN